MLSNLYRLVYKFDRYFHGGHLSNGIFLIEQDGSLVEMHERAYDTELILQKLLVSYPNLIPGDQIDDLNPRRWVLIAKEASVFDNDEGISRWYVDHLFLDQDGIPTLVEVKRSSDTRIRREVIGQILEYAANAVTYWNAEKLQATFEVFCQKNGLDAKDKLRSVLEIEEDYAAFWQKVEDNLKIGQIRLLIVADEIPTELRGIIEFLNEQMNPAEILGVEIKQFSSGSRKTLVPRVVGQNSIVKQKKSRLQSAKTQWTRESFLERIGQDFGRDISDLVENILSWTEKNGLRVWWGKGQKLGSLVPMLDYSDSKYFMFSIWTNATVEISFQWIKEKPIYNEKSNRLDLLRKLNKIPGIKLPEDSINRRPSFNLNSLLSPSNLETFLSVWDAYIKRIKNR